MSDEITLNVAWREYHEAQARRRQERVPRRIAEIRRGLPPGFCAETLNNGYTLRITGPMDFKLTYYPVHQRVQFRNQWRSMQASTVVKLMKEWRRE